MNIETGRGMLSDYGVSGNDDSDYDDEYLAKMSRKPKDLRLYYHTKVPIAEIRQALQTKEVPYEPGTREYLKARLEDKAECPICYNAQSSNRQVILEHIRAHDEVQGFLEGVIEAERQRDRLFERRDKIKQEIQKAKNELQTVESRIRKINNGAIAKRQAEYEELFALLYGSQP